MLIVATHFLILFFFDILYLFPYLQDLLHDASEFMLTFNCKFCFRCYFTTPTPMTNILISSVFHVNNSSVKMYMDSIQTGTDKILFGAVSIIYVSFNMMTYCAIRINKSLLCHPLCLKTITNGGSI